MSKKIMFCNMTDHVKNVFENNEENFDGYRNLLHDLANGVEIFDADNKIVPHAVAEENARNIAFSILGITKDSSRKQRKRALEAHGREWFAVSEEEIDIKVERGFQNSEFFNIFVEQRNQARGDNTEFYTEDPIYLSVVKTAGDFHEIGRAHV